MVNALSFLSFFPKHPRSHLFEHLVQFGDLLGQQLVFGSPELGVEGGDHGTVLLVGDVVRFGL
jgi:hypothetical protein